MPLMHCRCRVSSALILVLEHWGIDLAFNKHLPSENASVETWEIKMHNEEHMILKPNYTAWWPEIGAEIQGRNCFGKEWVNTKE